MMKKLWLSVIVVFLVFINSVSCGKGATDGDEATSGDSGEPATAVSDVFTEYSPEKLVSNGIAIENYSIIVKENALSSTLYAASELQSYIRQATGKTLDVKTDTSPVTSYEIILGDTNRSSDIDVSKLGEEGFTIKTVGLKLYIAADDDNATDSRGVLYGVYTYLEKLGYRFYATDVERIPEAEDVFVAENIDETQIPKLTYRDLTYFSALREENKKWSVKQKINGYFTRALPAKLGGSCEFAHGSGDASGLVHTSFHLVPETLLYSHPEYFALNAKTGERMAGEWNGQICYTNEGAYQYMKNSAISWLKFYPASEYISISINDNWHMCECADCRASDEKYGVTGTVLRFTNRLAEELAAEGYRQKVVFLAYFATAPVPKGGVVPAENVVVQLAVDCCQAHGIEEGRDCDIGNTFGSDEAKKSLREWGEISDSLMVYGYAACYINRIQPVPNYRSFLNTVRYYAEKANVKGHFADCIGECPSGEFGELKSYIFSKIQWDPYMSEAEMWYHVRDFLIGYYGESAAEYLFEYIKLTVEQVGDKCWENNLGNLKDKDIFFADGTPIDEKLVFIENVKALWDDAKDWCDDATCFERVERAYIQVMFYETEYIAAKHIRVDPTMKDYYDGVKTQLAATMSKYGITN